MWPADGTTTRLCGLGDFPRGRSAPGGEQSDGRKRGIDKAVEVAVAEIKRLSREGKGDMIAHRHNQPLTTTSKWAAHAEA